MLRAFSITCLAAILVACGSGGSAVATTPSAVSASTPVASPSPAPPTLSAADRAQLAQLEKRPLKIPAAPKDGSCNQGPFTPMIVPYANGTGEADVYGSGPVYGIGSPPIHAGPDDFFDVTYFTGPAVRSVVLVRINDLSRKYVGRFVGPLAVGTNLGTDVIEGQVVPAYSAAALPAEDPPANVPAAAPGWGVFHIRQGIDSRFTCAAIQIDTAAGTQVILGH